MTAARVLCVALLISLSLGICSAASAHRDKPRHLFQSSGMIHKTKGDGAAAAAEPAPADTVNTASWVDAGCGDICGNVNGCEEPPYSGGGNCNSPPAPTACGEAPCCPGVGQGGDCRNLYGNVCCPPLYGSIQNIGELKEVIKELTMLLKTETLARNGNYAMAPEVARSG